MGKRDYEYSLEDMIEHHEAYKTKATSTKEKNSKRGRGIQQKAMVAITAESAVLEDFKNGEIKKSCRYFKMRKTDNLKAKTAEKLIKCLIDSKAVLQTDESTTFSNFEDFIDIHVKEISSSKEGKFNLKWAHTVISNLKSSLTK